MLHQIIGRSIERCKVFFGKEDRDDFLRQRMGIVSQSTKLCYVWALLPNHFHLRIKNGNFPIATVMRRLIILPVQ